MNTNQITKVVILVEIEGKCHQVISSKENKQVFIELLANSREGLRLTQPIEPIEFQFTQPQQIKSI